MVFTKGVTEIADSEDEPMTSSPSSDAMDKLPGDAIGLPQEYQEPLPQGDCEHQASGDHHPAKIPVKDTIDQAETLNDAGSSIQSHPTNAQTNEDNSPQQEHFDHESKIVNRPSHVQDSPSIKANTEPMLTSRFLNAPSQANTDENRQLMADPGTMQTPCIDSGERARENSSISDVPQQADHDVLFHVSGPVVETSPSNSEMLAGPEEKGISQLQSDKPPPLDLTSVVKDRSNPMTAQMAHESTPHSSDSVADKMDVDVASVENGSGYLQPMGNAVTTTNSSVTTEEPAQASDRVEKYISPAATNQSCTQPIAPSETDTSLTMTEQQPMRPAAQTDVDAAACSITGQPSVDLAGNFESSDRSSTIVQKEDNPAHSVSENTAVIGEETRLAVGEPKEKKETEAPTSDCPESASLNATSMNISLQSTNEESMPSVVSSDDHIEPAIEPPHSSPVKPTTTTHSTKPLKPSQEQTVAELRTQRAALIVSLAALPNITDLLIADDSSIASDVPDLDDPTDADIMAAANKIVKKHIKLLHEYNEIKDVGEGLMGLIADQRGVRIVEVQEEFGVLGRD